MTNKLSLLAASIAAAVLAYLFWPTSNPGADGQKAAGPRSTPTVPAVALAAPVPVAPSSAPATANGGLAAPAADNRAADKHDGIRVLLSPEVETTLVSQLAGRVLEVRASLGSHFERGNVLVSFDCQEPRARLHMAEAALDSARQTHDAKLRLQGLEQASEVEVGLSASAVAKATAELALYRAQLTQCSVTAPFTGRAVKIGVKPYQGITPGQPLMDIVSSGALKLRLNAPAKWTPWLKPRVAFEVLIDETGKRYPAEVTAVNGRIDAVSQTIELEAHITGKYGDLLPGMSGTAQFNVPKK